MTRFAHTILVAAIAVLAGANLALLVWARGDASGARRPASAWQRWQALPASEQLACAQRYADLARREDAGAVLRRARDFARLPAVRQERLREVQGVFQTTLDRQNAAQRREILLAPPRARAYLLYQALAEQDPALVAQLRARYAAER